MDKSRLSKLPLQLANRASASRAYSLALPLHIPIRLQNDSTISRTRIPSLAKLYIKFERYISHSEDQLRLKTLEAKEVIGPSIDMSLFEELLLVPSSSNYVRTDVGVLIADLVSKHNFKDAHDFLLSCINSSTDIRADWVFLEAARHECSKDTIKALDWISLLPSDYNAWRYWKPSPLMGQLNNLGAWEKNPVRRPAQFKELASIFYTLQDRHSDDYLTLRRLILVAAEKGFTPPGIRSTLKLLVSAARPSFVVRCFHDCMKIMAAKREVNVNEMRYEFAVWAHTILFNYWSKGRRSLAVHLLGRFSRYMDLGDGIFTFLAQKAAAESPELVDRITALQLKYRPQAKLTRFVLPLNSLYFPQRSLLSSATERRKDSSCKVLI
ncbi:hypothetical protein BT69DRAFT_366012 [Atractiella rhizophila]|nr:hypothetical protein BT69DRAFT_366012 [Atractiella rhizophila]